MSTHNGFPIILNLNQMSILLVGGGNVAYRKLKILYPYTKRITVVSISLSEHIHQFINKNNINHFIKPFDNNDLNNKDLCIAATNSKEINHLIYTNCSQKKIWCNTVTDNENSHFTLPAFLQEKDLQIAISTGGKSPLLARKLRDELKMNFSKKYQDILEILGGIRNNYLHQIPESSKKIFWEEIYQAIIENYPMNYMSKDQLKQIIKKYTG